LWGGGVQWGTKVKRRLEHKSQRKKLAAKKARGNIKGGGERAFTQVSKVTGPPRIVGQ